MQILKISNRFIDLKLNIENTINLNLYENKFWRWVGCF